MKLESLPKFKFKRDAYARKRGASKMLMISCVQCSSYIMSYQKDGPGPLLRCYLDRIHHPPYLASRQNEKFDKQTAPHLVCPSCNGVIGVAIIYEKEDRPAYHLKLGSFATKKVY